MRFTLFYFANPNAVRIDLYGISLRELPHDVLYYEDYSPEALGFITEIEWQDGIEGVSLSNTAHSISIRKLSRVSWANTMMGILQILRDRFAPGQPLTNESMQGLPRCFDRNLTDDDFQSLPRPAERQLTLFNLD